MLRIIDSVDKTEYSAENAFCAKAKTKYFDSIYNNSHDLLERTSALYNKGVSLLELGKEEESIKTIEKVLVQVDGLDLQTRISILQELALAYMRLGERTNCVYTHSGESCIFPISTGGIHKNKTGSESAIEIYKQLLKLDANDLESRWLLNIAYMTIGGYPNLVPPKLLLKNLQKPDAHSVKPFTDVAPNIGLNTSNKAGGSIVEDFNNDGYLDIITSSWELTEGMHYSQNNGDGSFTDMSAASGLSAFGGGLNMMQTDYNNDGFKDIFVLRGAWKKKFGKEPNSLLRNNGDGTFTDVTIESGLLSFHPTQTATWADFNNDGWLDVFIGNESSSNDDDNFCELYMSNRNGTFTNVAESAGCKYKLFVKGVTSGDYNNDGLTDLFISTISNTRVLLRNEGTNNGKIHFKDVTNEAGVADTTRTFPTWFWDYNNDGWLDILVCDYDIRKSLAAFSAQESLNEKKGTEGRIYLYKNNQNGTFTEVSKQLGLSQIAFAMGANFGDIDNDGYLDFYLGTGSPKYQALIPNKMFHNVGGKRFDDVTNSSRTGNLQKGHGVSFADIDNDGDQDIYIEMGGVYDGDGYRNALYQNPGQSNNHWLDLLLTGTTCNRAAIGARIKISFTENGIKRSVYRDVNSGGSFGCNPLRQHAGIGQADNVESVEIKWPGSDSIQVVKNLKISAINKITQGSNIVTTQVLNISDFNIAKGLVACPPK